MVVRFDEAKQLKRCEAHGIRVGGVPASQSVLHKYCCTVQCQLPVGNFALTEVLRILKRPTPTESVEGSTFGCVASDNEQVLLNGHHSPLFRGIQLKLLPHRVLNKRCLKNVQPSRVRAKSWRSRLPNILRQWHHLVLRTAVLPSHIHLWLVSFLGL